MSVTTEEITMTTNTTTTTQSTSNTGYHGSYKNDEEADLTFLHQSEVNAVASPKINMPSLDKRHIEGWFLSLDYWFAAMSVKRDALKFNTVMSALDPKTLQDFLPTLGSPPDTGKYEYVKTRLVNFCTDSQTHRLNQMLNESQLGDQRPSQLFAEMKRLAGDSMSDSAVKNIWTKRLPIYAQAAVAACTGGPTEYLKIADVIVETISVQVNSVEPTGASYVATAYTPPTHRPPIATQKNEINELCTTINELTKRFDKMMSERSRPRNRSYNERKGSHQRQRSKTPANTDECWYHRKYGSESRNCRAPCKHFKGPNEK